MERFTTRRLDQYSSALLNRYAGHYIDIGCIHETPTNLCSIFARLSHESQKLSDNGGPRDLALLNRLIESGDEHAKAVRFKQFTLMIEAPRYWWAEMDTYTVGVLSLGSTSTMHKEAKGLKGDDLVKFKSDLPEGTLQLRAKQFSYHAIKRIVSQRKKHRLPEWQEFYEWAETYAKL